jgi:His/Glu/Gln/Arg/opine family amino acid ABC transporter permease subunit
VSELWGVVERGFPELLAGFIITCQLVGVSFLIAMVVGVLVAAFRVAPVTPLRWVGGFYVETFRNIPLLVLLFIFFAGLRRGGLEIPAFLAAVASLGLYTAAYVAEAIRSGVFAVGKGQIEASLSLGLSYRRTLSKIILPQAIRTVIPPLGNLTIAMIKNSAIIGASLVPIAPDLLKEAKILRNKTLQTNETFFWAAVGYLILTLTATFVVRYLEKRWQVRR